MATLDIFSPHSTQLYTPEQVKLGEGVIAAELDIDLYDLMCAAGQSIFEFIVQDYSQAQSILVCCGKGNNGGDGYTVARLLKTHGFQVDLWQIGDPNALRGDAERAKEAWLNEGGHILPPQRQLPQHVDLIIDALLGIGVKGQLRPEFISLIESINTHSVDTISIDLPSGLCARTGAHLGAVIQATHTLTLVALKQGLFTGQARAYIGHLSFFSLGVNERFITRYIPQVHLLNKTELKHSLPKRSPVAHKGDFGRALMIGGDEGMGGAIILACESLARSGTGLFSVLTHPSNTSALLCRRPEAMVKGQHQFSDLELRTHIQSMQALVVGPGLGLQEWGSRLWKQIQVNHDQQSLLIDADALSLLSLSEPWWTSYSSSIDIVLTPHPGEAAKLLNISTAQVESDRFAAVRAIALKYKATVVLKGAGTLIDDGEHTWICPLGNSGMASGGMGDVLSGIIGAFLAQGVSARSSALLGVWLHSCAADLMVKSIGQVGLLASDLIKGLPQAFRELSK